MHLFVCQSTPSSGYARRVPARDPAGRARRGPGRDSFRASLTACLSQPVGVAAQPLRRSHSRSLGLYTTFFSGAAAGREIRTPSPQPEIAPVAATLSRRRGFRAGRCAPAHVGRLHRGRQSGTSSTPLGWPDRVSLHDGMVSVATGVIPGASARPPGSRPRRWILWRVAQQW